MIKKYVLVDRRGGALSPVDPCTLIEHTRRTRVFQRDPRDSKCDLFIVRTSSLFSGLKRFHVVS